MMALAVCMLALVAGAQTTEHSGPWELEGSGSTAGLRGVHNVGGGVVWASGTGGTVLRSEDTGYLWQQCTTPPGAGRLDFRGIRAWDAQNVLVMSSGPGDQSRLYETTDGCTSWKLLLTNPDAAGFWDGILFLDRKHGVIYGDPVPDATRTHSVLPLRMTLDGGTTWTFDRKSPQPLPGESIFAASNSAMTVQQEWIWLGTSKARVLRGRAVSQLLWTEKDREAWFSLGENHEKACGSGLHPLRNCSNTGADWDSAQTPLASGNDSSGVFSVAFRDQMHGIAVGGDYRKPEEASGTAAYTSDGGGHWSAARTLPHGYRSAVAWDTKDQAWITVGSNGSDISYDDGETWQWLDGGNWNALSLPWAVGPNGQIGKLGTLPAHPAAAARVSR
jgi:photosystem II stability/assembly factor-like uncharacterized protein